MAIKYSLIVAIPLALREGWQGYQRSQRDSPLLSTLEEEDPCFYVRRVRLAWMDDIGEQRGTLLKKKKKVPGLPWCSAHQETQVQSLIWEDATWLRAAEPMLNCTLEPCSFWAHVPQLLKPVYPRPCAPQQEKPPQWEAQGFQRRAAPSHHS